LWTEWCAARPQVTQDAPHRAIRGYHLHRDPGLFALRHLLRGRFGGAHKVGKLRLIPQRLHQMREIVDRIVETTQSAHASRKFGERDAADGGECRSQQYAVRLVIYSRDIDALGGRVPCKRESALRRARWWSERRAGQTNGCMSIAHRRNQWTQKRQ